MDKPTEEGRRRYPPDGLYKAMYMYVNEHYPCQCTPECKNPCDGRQCNCKACQEPHACQPSVN